MMNPINKNTSTDNSQSSKNHISAFDLQENTPINWRKYIFLFLHNWHWFLITLGIALGIAFFKLRYTIPNYQATAKLIIEQEDYSQDMVSQIRAVRYWRRQTDLANEIAKISAFTTIKRAVDSVDQDIFWTAHGRIRIRPVYLNSQYEFNIQSDTVNWYLGKQWFIDYIDKQHFRLYLEESFDTIVPFDSIITINNWIFVNKLLDTPSYKTYSFIINDPIALAKSYKSKIKFVANEENGTIISLQSEGPVGEREADFLNNLSYIYILSELERKQTIAENTFSFIDGQINVILDSLKRAETQLLTFRLSNNVINLSREGEIAYERLKSFNEQRTELKLQEDYYNYLKRYIDERNDPQTIIAPTLTGDGDQLLVAAVNNLQELYAERENLELSVKPNNPGVESINKRIRSVRERIIAIVNGLIENNLLTQEQIQTEEQSIINQLKSLPVSEQQLLNIKRKYDLYNQFYTFLLEKRAEAGIQKASAISNARVLDPARHDQLVVVGSDKKIILMIAILLGLILPGVILLLRELLDNRIKEKDDIVRRTDIPIIGLIGHSDNSMILPTSKDANSIFIETLRRIRANLSFVLREKKSQVIMITSSISGEGKTFGAANLASIIALNNKKVLLVGCDLRKPTLHKLFKTSKDVGLTSFIIGESTIKEVIFKSTVENLYILPSGPIPPNPAELIETEEMRELFNYARTNFDVTIIDTPPVALVADTLSLSMYADLTLYVIRQNHSHKRVLELANSLSDENILPRPYLLINDIKPSRSIGMYYYYGYGEAYNYGYYDTKNYS